MWNIQTQIENRIINVLWCDLVQLIPSSEATVHEYKQTQTTTS